MSEFKCIFLDHDVDADPDLEFYADFFLNYQSAMWQKGCGDGVFSFVSEEGDKSELSVLENKELGISVRYNIRTANERRGAEFYSVGDQQKMNQVEDFGEDQFVPAGSFLEPKIAWLAVEDFFKNPLVKSRRIVWLHSEDISWPDI
ncbi:hypothetical protein HKK58_20480 [Pseudomonas sp. ADAK22]|uniref:hypothetical protein n=1 Tax=Pseudomonas sp. ADAK22 TaxID=2730851 RepID=UPI00146408A9|nr:hypothetical protein [Pseudomonas sp. ADAK22]QJI14822.1 hypothetical protein HKK58_20480 [Pseudomonas sp. ADAK22]